MQLHGSMSAVKIVDGQIISLLCGGGDYSENIVNNEIKYLSPNRPHYKKSISTFESAIILGYKFNVYFKIKKNEWSDLGVFLAKSIKIKEKNYEIQLIGDTRSL